MQSNSAGDGISCVVVHRTEVIVLYRVAVQFVTFLHTVQCCVVFYCLMSAAFSYSLGSPR